MARILSQDAQRLLGDVPPEKSFWCRDGRAFKNIQELSAALATMSDETFGHHANAGRNDFSNWVKEVIGDEKLARDLAKSTTRTAANKKVMERIIFLTTKL
ncbi:MAG: hypothetical protein HYX91_02490 [Chloroflexi bacterium]|nr:hypothetical protein [Chloroflexota bacterium]